METRGLMLVAEGVRCRREGMGVDVWCDWQIGRGQVEWKECPKHVNETNNSIVRAFAISHESTPGTVWSGVNARFRTSPVLPRDAPPREAHIASPAHPVGSSHTYSRTLHGDTWY